MAFSQLCIRSNVDIYGCARAFVCSVDKLWVSVSILFINVAIRQRANTQNYLPGVCCWCLSNALLTPSGDLPYFFLSSFYFISFHINLLFIIITLSVQANVFRRIRFEFIWRGKQKKDSLNLCRLKWNSVSSSQYCLF